MTRTKLPTQTLDSQCMICPLERSFHIGTVPLMILQAAYNFQYLVLPSVS